jgi:hypothetical protein
LGLPPLVADGGAVTATQECCGIKSGHSKPVPVDSQAQNPPIPVVAGPLYGCGAAVHVSNLHPGATVDVWSTKLDAPMASAYAPIGPYAPMGPATTTQVDVAVSPLLIAGDQIYAVQHACGHNQRSANDKDVLVQKVKSVDRPWILPPVEACMKSVTVWSVVPGARVDVYVDSTFWRGSAIATATTVEVPILGGSLQVQDKVQARPDDLRDRLRPEFE